MLCKFENEIYIYMNYVTFLAYELLCANELFSAIHGGSPCLVEVSLIPGENQQNCYSLSKDLLLLSLLLLLLLLLLLILLLQIEYSASMKNKIYNLMLFINKTY